MSYLVWSSDLNTGIGKVDDEHREIVTCANQLYDAVERNESREVLVLLSENLIDVTTAHFQEEEKLMEESNYQYFEIHRGMHQRMLKLLSEHVDNLRAGHETARPLLKAMENWLFMHIRTNDRGYLDAVMARAA